MTILCALLVVVLWVKLQRINAELVVPGASSYKSVRGGTLAVLLLLAAPISLFSPFWRWASLVALNAALTSLTLLDALHFRYYGEVLSASSLYEVPQVYRMLPSVGPLVRRTDLLLFVDVLTGLLLFPWILGTPAEPIATRAQFAAVLAVGGIVVAIPTIRLVATDPNGVFEYVFQRREIVTSIGILPYHVYDILMHGVYSYAVRISVSDAEVRRAEELLVERRRDTQVDGRYSGAARGLNIIAVSAESLQRFVIGLEVDQRPVAPNLTAFANDALRFTRFYDQTHLGTTADAEWAALHSLYPLARGAVATRYIGNDFRALPAILKEHGYITLSACAEPASFWNMGEMHARLGFERSFFSPDYRFGEWIGMGLADYEFFEQTVPKLNEAGEPFFSYLITSSVHWPFNLPEAHRTFDPGRFRGTLVGAYLQAIHYFDRAFGRFIDRLRDIGLLDRSLVVVFGDHQAHLGDEPEVADLLSLPERRLGDHETSRRWNLAHDVPLLIRFPHASRSGIHETPGGHLDIAPTLLSLAGIIEDRRVMLGSGLMAARESPVVFRDGSVVAGNAIFVHEANSCYDSTSGDPLACDSRKLVALARRDLEASDAIVRGNLVNRLTDTGQRVGRARPPARTMVVAHRGYSARFPENTLAAISAAFDVGADIVEVDVRLSQDGVPIVIHNDTLDETTNGSGLVATRTFAELRQLDAGSWKDARFRGERIPSFEEALEAARGRGRLLIDVNADSLASPIARMYKRLGIKEDDAVIGAWTAEQIKEFVREMPHALILHSSGPPDRWDAQYFEGFKALGVRGFEVGGNWPPHFVDSAHAAGMPVMCYTINDEGTMRRLIRMGVDAIETDEPEVAMRFCGPSLALETPPSV